MNLLEIKILETAIAVVLFFLIRIVIIALVKRTVTKNLLKKVRGKIIRKIFQILLTSIAVIFLLTVWGVDQSQLFMFLASVMTVIGIALFAQWSHLSNLTSGVIIFFNHSVRLEDSIIIMDKDYNVEGRISDIGLFFVNLITKDDEEISLPNNVFLQKMIKKKRESYILDRFAFRC